MQASENLSAVVRDLKDVAALRNQASSISRLHREIESATAEVAALQTQMSTSGSTKTADDVQAEVDDLSNKM